MVEDIIFKTLSLCAFLSQGQYMQEHYGDFYYTQDEKVMSYSISLISEIDQLLEEGLSKEEIREIIENCNFTEKDPNLTQEEGDYLKKYSLRLLNIRYELMNEKLEFEGETKTSKKKVKVNRYESSNIRRNKE